MSFEAGGVTMPDALAASGFNTNIFNVMLAIDAGLGVLVALWGLGLIGRTTNGEYEDAALAAARCAPDKGALTGWRMAEEIVAEQNDRFGRTQASAREDESGAEKQAADTAQLARPDLIARGTSVSFALLLGAAVLGGRKARWTWSRNPSGDFYAVVIVVVLGALLTGLVTFLRRQHAVAAKRSRDDEIAQAIRLQTETGRDSILDGLLGNTERLDQLALRRPLLTCAFVEQEKPSLVTWDRSERDIKSSMEQQSNLNNNQRVLFQFALANDSYWDTPIGSLLLLRDVYHDLAWLQSLVGRYRLWEYRRRNDEVGLAQAIKYLKRANPGHDPVAAAALARALELRGESGKEVSRHVGTLCEALNTESDLHELECLLTSWAVPVGHVHQSALVDALRRRDAADHQCGWLPSWGLVMLRLEQWLVKDVGHGKPTEWRVLRCVKLGNKASCWGRVDLLILKGEWANPAKLPAGSLAITIDDFPDHAVDWATTDALSQALVDHGVARHVHIRIAPARGIEVEVPGAKIVGGGPAPSRRG